MVCVCTCIGWHDWHGWRAAESRAIKWIAVQCCSWALQRVKVQSTHAEEIHWRGNSPHSKHVLALILFPSEELSFATGSLWLNSSLCMSLPRSRGFCGHPLADAVNSSPLFHSMPLPSWITACLPCMSRRRAEWQKEGSQRFNFPAPQHGWSSVTQPVILTRCCDPLPL